jgi:hypothetical protein
MMPQTSAISEKNTSTISATDKRDATGTHEWHIAKAGLKKKRIEQSSTGRSRPFAAGRSLKTSLLI